MSHTLPTFSVRSLPRSIQLPCTKAHPRSEHSASQGVESINQWRRESRGRAGRSRVLMVLPLARPPHKVQGVAQPAPPRAHVVWRGVVEHRRSQRAWRTHAGEVSGTQQWRNQPPQSKGLPSICYTAPVLCAGVASSCGNGPPAVLHKWSSPPTLLSCIVREGPRRCGAGGAKTGCLWPRQV